MKQLAKIVTTTLSLSLAVAPRAWAQTPPSQVISECLTGRFSVVIDAGHGGADKGEDEKERNLSLALQLRTELEKRGARVILTRSKDEFLPLQARVDVANTIKPDCFISLHGQHEKGRPFSYILNYYNPTSVPLAEALNEGLVRGLNSTFKSPPTPARYYVLRKLFMPAVMVTQNLDTPSTPKSQHQFAVALAEGIGDYAQGKGAPSGDVPILRDLPNLGKLFKSPPKIQQAPQSAAPGSSMLRKPPSTFNYLSAKIGE